jgi:Fe2+ transport system protein FeoA
MKNLSLINTGEKVIVIGINENKEKCICNNCNCLNNKHGFQRHILKMGIMPGKTIEVLNNNQDGALLIRIDEMSFSLSKGLAKNIFVKAIH